MKHNIKAAEVPTGKDFIQAVDPAANATSDLKKCDGVAYSGGFVRQWWSRLPMVVDLAGMEITSQTPLLMNHENEPEAKLGDVSATINGGQILISGGIAPDTPEAKHIVEMGKKFSWQLSIGAEIMAVEEINPEDARTINGREFQGPFLHIKKSRLREVSVVAVGADPETSLQIAACLKISPTQKTTINKGVFHMEKNLREFIQAKYNLGNCDDAAILAHLAKIGSTVEDETASMKAKNTNKPEPAAPAMTEAQIQAAAEKAAQNMIEARAKAEAERVADIKAACGTEFAESAEEFISLGYSAEDTKKIVAALKKQAKAIPAASGNIIIKNGPAVNAKSLEAALALTYGIDEASVVRDCGEQNVEAGSHLRGITLKGLAELCCRMENRSTPVVFGDETIRAALSTASLPGILGNVANKRALQSFAAQPIIATRLCSWGDLNDFKESDRFRLSTLGSMEEVTEGGEIKHATLAEEKATNQLKTYGKMLTVSRQMFYNDDLGLLMKLSGDFGRMAAVLIDELFFHRLLANPTMEDGKALFCADHGNYITGTAGALSASAIKSARAKFLKQTDKNGKPINVLPKFLLCPSGLDATAQELLSSLNLTGGSTAGPALNIVSRFGLETVSAPFLEISSFDANASATGWYLFGDPNQVDTFEIGCLQGKRTPTIEHANTDFNTLGMQFRTYFDVGVREQEHRGIVFNKGVD